VQGVCLSINTPWPESVSELYRPSDRRLSTKLVLTFADKECHVVSTTDPYGRILGFLDRSRYFSLPSSSSIVLNEAEWRVETFSVEISSNSSQLSHTVLSLRENNLQMEWNVTAPCLESRVNGRRDPSR
jgi:hypothetical protein